MSIEIKNVSHRFGDTQALDHVSISIKEGGIYGLLGNNGAGKSTLLHILCDRLLPNEGEVTVDGENVRNNDKALQKLFLAGDKNLFPEDMRVGTAIKTMGWFYPSFDKDYALATADKFGLNTKKKITALSTGYASIFRLVLGLSVNTPYLLFDEPVLGLDAQHRDLFYRLLLEKVAEGDCTVLLSTHLINEVSALLEHCFILCEGKLLKDAPTEELLQGSVMVTGPAEKIDAWANEHHVLSEKSLGGIKSVAISDFWGEVLPEGFELRAMDLQEYFISLMEEEEKK